MFNTKIVILALSAVTAAATASTSETFRDQRGPIRITAAIPLQVVGDTVSVKITYSPVTHCADLKPGMDIDVISACAVKRVGWLKL